MDEENTSVTRLPQGRQEHQKFVDHTILLAYHTNRKVCFLQSFVCNRVNRCVFPQEKEYAEESNPDMAPELALEAILDET